MKILFITNYFNDHLKEFCDELYANYGDSFLFFETEKNFNHFEKSRMSSPKPKYVHGFSELHQIDVVNADAVIFGSAPYEIISMRVKQDIRPTFLYQERSLKKASDFLKFPYRYFKWHKRYGRKKNCFVLCASAFTSGDYKKFCLFKDKCFKFGYFPNRNFEQVDYASKTIDSIFVARLVPLKHPEIFVKLCGKAVTQNKDFKAIIIGEGPMKTSISNLIKRQGLEKNIEMVGYKTNKEVLDIMKNSKTFVFASDSREGWGTVINESMSCGCVPFVSSKVGCSKFLIDEGKNGFVFASLKDLNKKYKSFVESENQTLIANNSFETIKSEWNGVIAGQRFIKILNNNLSSEFKTGPLSFSK